MIRVDELYSNTFWPYIQENVLYTRMFNCDPPGNTDPESLLNYDINQSDLNYIFFHDQEPIHLDIHKPLFDDVVRRNIDMRYPDPPLHRALITSEYASETVDQVCSLYDWRPYYYFYHGWAALDWYRGYDKTFLIPDPEKRKIKKSFITPNRIIGGRRDHRSLLLYHLFRQGINRAWISAPQTCVVENETIVDIAKKYQYLYPDIVTVLDRAPLPAHFPGETDHPMHSCWLSLWDQVGETLAYVVTETVFFGQRHHLTEKTFKPICQKIPFVLVSTAGSLEYLRRYGFRTFGYVWDESYDEETDDIRRLEKIAKLLLDFDALSEKELQNLYRATLPAIRHNHQHFYNGGFEKTLWSELITMLNTLEKDFRD